MFLNVTERRMTSGLPPLGRQFGLFEPCKFSNIALEKSNPSYVWEIMLYEGKRFVLVTTRMSFLSISNWEETAKRCCNELLFSLSKGISR